MMKIKQITYLVGMALFTTHSFAATSEKLANRDVMSVWSTPVSYTHLTLPTILRV